MKINCTIPAVLFFIFLSFACSNNPPEVRDIRWDLYISGNSEKENVREELSVFFLVNDDDGAEDIDEIYVICDPELTYWKLTREDWTEKAIEGGTWIGSSGLQSPELFPRNEYRFIVIDKSGDRTEGDFFMNANTVSPGIVFPTAEVSENEIRVRTSVSQAYLSVYDANNIGIALIGITPGTYATGEILKSLTEKKAEGFYILEKAATEGYYLKSGFYHFPSTDVISESSEQVAPDIR